METKSKLKGNSPILFLVVCCLLIMSVNSFASDEISPGGSRIPPEQWEKEPPMKKGPLPSQLLGLKPDSSKVLHLPPIDVDKLIEEDKAVKGKGKPARMGIHREVNASPLTHGEWYEIGKGSIWIFEIHAPSAWGLEVHFSDFYLPEGMKVFVHSPTDTDNYDGPYSGGGPGFSGGNFSSGIIGGDTVIIELFINKTSDYDYSKAPFKIDIGYLYRHRSQQSMSGSDVIALAVTCHNDATCPQYSEWYSDGDALGRIIYKIGGSWLHGNNIR